MNLIESLVYPIAKASGELFFFGCALSCLLFATYCIFFLLKKRRFGSMEQTVPSPIIKGYLTELMSEAHFLRTQLFGLMSDAGVPTQFPRQMSSGAQAAVLDGPSLSSTDAAPIAAASSAAGAIAADPDLTKKLQDLESKVTSQNLAVTNLSTEKTKLIKELELAKAAGGKDAGGDGGDASEDLRKKVAELEAKLAEYSVIEDDLANLKRLQQENAQLKEALEGKGGAVPALAAEAALTPSPSPAPEPEPAPAPEPAPEPVAEPVAEAAPPPSTDQPTEQFEGLVDQVEASLQPDAAPEAVAAEPTPAAEPEPAPAPETPAAPAEEKKAEPPAEASTETAEAGNNDKSDDDLLSEFEKMLNM